MLRRVVPANDEEFDAEYVKWLVNDDTSTKRQIADRAKTMLGAKSMWWWKKLLPSQRTEAYAEAKRQVRAELEQTLAREREARAAVAAADQESAEMTTTTPPFQSKEEDEEEEQPWWRRQSKFVSALEPIPEGT